MACRLQPGYLEALSELLRRGAAAGAGLVRDLEEMQRKFGEQNATINTMYSKNLSLNAQERLVTRARAHNIWRGSGVGGRWPTKL